MRKGLEGKISSGEKCGPPCIHVRFGFVLSLFNSLRTGNSMDETDPFLLEDLFIAQFILLLLIFTS